MKRIIAAFALFAAAAIGSVTRVSAQELALHANVPFNFTVGDQQLPLGTYLITPSVTSAGTKRVLIENRGQGVSASAIGGTTYRSADGRTKLVFDKVGNQYFLKELVSTSAMIAFPMSKLEAQMLQEPLDSDAKVVIP